MVNGVNARGQPKVFQMEGAICGLGLFFDFVDFLDFFNQRGICGERESPKNNSYATEDNSAGGHPFACLKSRLPRDTEEPHNSTDNRWYSCEDSEAQTDK